MLPSHHTIIQPVTIAVLSDIHYGDSSPISSRRTDLADIMLLRAVHRLNRYLKPDITVVLGDILDAGDAPGASERRIIIRDILEKLDSPFIVIPGNHDGDVDIFYQDFDRPEPIEQIGGVRYLSFIDAYAPGYNAIRDEKALKVFKQARYDFDGPIVALQHVCLHPPGQSDIPYNYINVENIVAAMKGEGVNLSISGHYHEGADPMVAGSMTFINAPGMCEYPFRFTVVRLDSSGVTSRVHQLAIPSEFQLVDRHVHTQLAYCQENMTVEKAIALARAFGLHGLGFAEHSGQLYYPRERYWDGAGYRAGLMGARKQNNRVSDYMMLTDQYRAGNVRFGMEVDIDYKGRLLLKAEDRKPLDFVLGSIHSTPNIKNTDASAMEINAEFMGLMEKLLMHNIDVVTHPFRVFKRAGLPKPEELFVPVADMLAQAKTAAEINFHGNVPPLPFIQACLQRGVKFSLGSDSHNLYEVGEFAPHLQLLREAGFDGELGDILLPHDVGGFV